MATTEQEVNTREQQGQATPVTNAPRQDTPKQEFPKEDHAERPQLTGQALYLVIGGLMLSMLVSALDQTIVGTAMPRIITELKGFELVSWVTTAYLLTSTASIPIMGKLSDIFGRKYLIMAGIAIFTLGSALAGTSQDINQLIYYRAFQGIGAGALLSVIFTVVGDIFTPQERAKWQGLFFGMFGLASVIGPTVGGWLTDNAGWRWCFYVNIPLELLSIAVIYFALPASLGRTRKEDTSLSHELARIDFGGAFFSLVFIVPLLLALVWGGQTYPWDSWQVVGGFVLAVVGLAGFIFVEMRAKEPILPLELFKNDVFTTSAILGLLGGAAMFGIILYSPWFVQGVIGKSATSSGAILTPLMLMIVLGSIVTGQVVSRIGRYKLFVIAGTIAMTVGAFLLWGMGIGTDEGTVIRNIIIVGIGLGLYSPMVTLAAQNSLPMNRLASGTAAITFLRSIGQTIGAAVIGTVVTSTFTSNLHDHISAATISKVQAGVAPFAARLGQTPAQLTDNIFSVRSLTDPTFRDTSKASLTAILGP
ncbi:MAG: MFS transporter, partial [Candidatus Chloroheliales bacterium]